MKNVFCILYMSLFFINCSSQDQIKTISTEELKTLIDKENIQLLDVRAPHEVKKGYIEKALFVNFYNTDFTEKAIKKLNIKKPVYLYCRTGNRSGKAANLLLNKGFVVYNVLGGYSKWKKEN